MCDDTFNDAICFQFLLLALLIEVESFNVFTGYPRGGKSRLPNLVSLDIVVHAFQSFETFEEFICLICVMEMRKVFPFDMEALLAVNHRLSGEVVEETYHIVKPQIFWIRFPTFIPAMTEYGLNFVFLLVLYTWIDIVSRISVVVVIKLFKILDIIDIVGDLATPARDPDLVRRCSGLLLLLGTRAIFGIGVGG
jgi:hypothetical protein